MAVWTWTCPQGHRWEQTGAASTQKAERDPRCPVCGARGEPSGTGSSGNGTTVETPEISAADAAATLDGNDRDSAPETRPDQTLIGSSDLQSPVPTIFTGQDSQDPAQTPRPGAFATPRSAKLAAAAARIPPANAPKVPGYEVLGILGRGAMGVVYEALQVGLNRFTALKMILAGDHAGEEDRFRFRTEAEACARLQHPHIVQIYEVGQAGGHLFFSLELVEGGTLEQRIGGKPMPHRQAAEIVAACARAMDYAHREGILHRDLKSANVLLTPEGTPKITDFGLAKNLLEDSGHTGSGSILGTPSYMAPEQAQGKVKELTPAADIYALGAILYDTLTGRPPFCGETLLDTLRQVQDSEPIPPSRFEPKVPRDLETICLKCLRKEPTKRYATAGTLAEDLDRFLRGDPIAARPVGWWERAWRWARRRPAVAALVTVLLLLGAALVVGYPFLIAAWREAEDARKEAVVQQGLAEEQKGLAQKERDKAQEERDRARKAEAVATTERRRAEASLAAANTNLAQMAYFQYDRNRLNELLGRLDRKDPQFEYRLLDRFLQSEAIRLNSHIERLTVLKFQPTKDGSTLFASGSRDGTVVVWNLNKERVQRSELGPVHDGPVRSLAFDPFGGWLATGGADGKVFVWDLAKILANRKEFEKPTAVLQGSRPGILALAVYGPRLAVGSEDGSVSLWELPSPDQGKPMEIRRWKDHRPPVRDLRFSLDGIRLASAGMDGMVRIRDVKTGDELFALHHDRWVQALAFSPSGNRLVTATATGTLTTWAADGTKQDETSLLKALGELDVPANRTAVLPVRSLGFGPYGRRLAVGLQDHSVVVMLRRPDDRGWEAKFHLPAGPRRFPTTTFLEDGQKLGIVDFDLVASERKDLRLIVPLESIAFAEQGAAVVVGDQDGRLHWWRPDARKVARTAFGHQGAVVALAVRPDGDTTASGGEDGQVLVWQKDGNQLEITRLQEWVKALAFHPRDNLLAVGGSAGTLRLVDAAGKKPARDLPVRQGGVRCLAWLPGGKVLLVGGNEGKLVGLNVADGKALFDIELPGAVTALAVDPDGKTLAAAGGDRTIRMLAVDGDAVQEMRQLKGHGDTVTALRFTEDGKRLLSASGDGTVRIWEPNLGQELLSLTGHKGTVTGIALDRAGHRLATIGTDGTVLLWEADPAR